MKLRTEMEGSVAYARRMRVDEMNVLPEQSKDLQHDVAAAHALMRAVETVRGYYPESAFPEDGESLDCKSASMARHTCDNIMRRADELMREWGFE